MKPPPPRINPFRSSYPQQTNLPFQPTIPFTFPQYLQAPSNSRTTLQAINLFRPPPPQKINFPLQSLPPHLQNPNLTRFPPPLPNSYPTSRPLPPQQNQHLGHLPSFQSPQPFSLSDLPALKMKYEDFMKRREGIKKKIDQICQIKNEEIKEKELRNLIFIKPKMEEALVLKDLLRKAGSNIAFQKELLEVEKDIELSNKYLKRLQGLWLLSETQLSDWKIPQDLGEIDNLLQSTWDDIFQLLIYDPIFLEEILRFGWFFLAKVVLRHNRADCEFPYIKHCQDLKKSALENRDEKRKKSLLYRRIGRELLKHKRLVEKVRQFKQDLDHGMDIEKMDIEKIESLLRELNRFGFDVKEEVKYLEEILRKISQLKHVSLLFEEKSSIQLLDERESILLERDQEKIQKEFLVETPICKKIERDQSCVIVESFNMDFEAALEEEKLRKISALESFFLPKPPTIEPSSCKNYESLKDYPEVRLRKKAIVKNISPKITVEFSKAQEEERLEKSLIVLENSFSQISLNEKSLPIKPSYQNNERCKDYQEERLIIIDSPSPKRKTKSPSPLTKQSFPRDPFRNEWQIEQEENMRSLLSDAKIILYQKKKLPFKLAEKICLQYTEHHLNMPEAEEIYNCYIQEINRIQCYYDDLTSHIHVLTFEDLCKWSEKTRNTPSNLEGGYDEIKAEVWLAKARLIKALWDSLAKSSKPICFREIRNLIVKGENYEDFFTGIKKAIFQDFVNFLKHLVKKIFRKVQKEANRKEILLKNGIIYGFIDIKKELLGEVNESKDSKKLTQTPEFNFQKEQIEPCFETLNKKRSLGEVENSDIIFFDLRKKKLKTDMNNQEKVSTCQKKNQESKVKGKLGTLKELINKGEILEDCICIGSDSDETMAGSEIEEVCEGNSDLVNLEQLNKELWNNVSENSFRLKRKEYDDFDKSQEI